PSIWTDPVSQRAITNTAATFSVLATASPLPSYQWYSVIGGGTNAIGGATGTSYTTGPVQDSDSGNGYFVIVSTSASRVVSTTALVTAGHMVAAAGYLIDAQYNGNYANNFTALTTLYPTASLPAL